MGIVYEDAVAAQQAVHLDEMLTGNGRDAAGGGERGGKRGVGGAEDAGTHGPWPAGKGAGENAHPGQDGGRLHVALDLYVADALLVHLEEHRVLPAIRHGHYPVGEDGQEGEQEEDADEHGDGLQEVHPGEAAGQQDDERGDEPRHAGRHGQHPHHIVEDDGAAEHVHLINPAVFAVLAEHHSVSDRRYRCL